MKRRISVWQLDNNKATIIHISKGQPLSQIKFELGKINPKNNIAIYKFLKHIILIFVILNKNPTNNSNDYDFAEKK